MLKELQKQIQEKKNEILAPLVGELEQIFSGFSVAAEINDEMSDLSVVMKSKGGGVITEIKFFTGENEGFSTQSFEYVLDKNGSVVGVKSLPVHVSFQLIAYVFQKLIQLTNELQAPEESEVEVEEQTGE